MKTTLLILTLAIFASCEKEALTDYTMPQPQLVEQTIHDSVPVYWAWTDTATKEVYNTLTTYKSASCGSHGGGSCDPYYSNRYKAWIIKSNKWAAPKCK